LPIALRSKESISWLQGRPQRRRGDSVQPSTLTPHILRRTMDWFARYETPAGLNSPSLLLWR
jgi:hypothetical protein